MKGQKKIFVMTIIIGRRKKDYLLTLLTEQHCPLITTCYGQGTVDQNYLEKLMGLTPEEEKVIINCLVREDHKQDILDMLIEKCHFNQANTGIAFTAPVENIVF